MEFSGSAPGVGVTVKCRQIRRELGPAHSQLGIAVLNWGELFADLTANMCESSVWMYACCGRIGIRVVVLFPDALDEHDFFRCGEVFVNFIAQF